MKNWFLVPLSALTLGVMCIGNSFASELDNLTIFVPGSEGGGFDRTGIAIRNALIEEGLVDQVEIIRSPGAGGLIGLAQFVESKRGDNTAVFLGGRTNIGATDFNRATVSLKDTQPVARLNNPTIVIAVASSSSIKDLGDLISTFRTDPEALKWVGGSMGSQDELFLLQVAKALGIDRKFLNYQAIPGGETS